jgi:hypothetical protein
MYGRFAVSVTVTFHYLCVLLIGGGAVRICEEREESWCLAKCSPFWQLFSPPPLLSADIMPYSLPVVCCPLPPQHYTAVYVLRRTVSLLQCTFPY